jgi:uncharacterized protein (TIGR00303 family)
MRLVTIGGTTETARIDGLSAAGADPELLVHTPSADLEVLVYGRPVLTPVVPVSPSGCPTPAVVTRAARDLLGFEVLAIDAGLGRPTGAPTVGVSQDSGADIRSEPAVPEARATFEAARQLGRELPDEALFIAETIPGGTTTAMAVLSALGERTTVSSSLATNPLSLKRAVVEEALGASGLSDGEAAQNPIEALRAVGDPVLAAAAGFVCGASEAGTRVTLAGGTQLAAVGALARHAGIEAALSLATTSFVAADDSADIVGLADAFDLECLITDPGFEQSDHPAMEAYVAGEAKEGVGMGGALALIERSDVPMAALRERVSALTERLGSNDEAAIP